jgi:hypothetical protein
MMSQVAPVNLELAMIIHVHQFMNESMFHVFLAEKVTSTKNDSAWVGAKSSGPRQVARSAQNI